MNAYIYCADIWCEACGRAIRERLAAEGKAPANSDDETSYDSGDFPKGPFEDGGGAADCPQHCAAGADCLEPTVIDGQKYGCFLDNPLTADGESYVRDLLASRPEGRVARFWANHYRLGGENPDDPEPPCGD